MVKPPALTENIERAKKILQFEQRTNHQDQAIKPGGLEVFAARWAEDTSNICNSVGVDVAPIHHLMEYLAGYRKQDPMQRAASIRSALGILNELGNENIQPINTQRSETPKTAMQNVQQVAPSARTAAPIE